MFKVADTRQYHAYALGIAVVNAILIFDRAPRLYHRGDACFMGDGYTVREGEEGIGGHDGSFQVEAKLIGFGNGLSQSIHSGGLSYARGKKLRVVA